MSVKIMGVVWDADLPRDEKFILLSYADHAAHDGTGIYPSVDRTAWKTGYHRRSVQTITKKLVERHILILDGKGWNNTNRYRLDVTALPQRENYKGGAEFAPCKKQQEGVQKTAGGGANFAPNPSCNRHEPSHGEDAVEDTALEDALGSRQHPVPRREPIHSNGNWRKRLRDNPYLAWGNESQEVQRQVERYGSGGRPVLELGYELERTLGLRPAWGNRQEVRTWTSGLVECLENADHDWQLVVSVARQMREEGLSIKNPHSIKGMVADAAAKRRSKVTQAQHAQQRMEEDPQYQTFKQLREASERS